MWQKRARAALAVLMVAVAVAVFVFLRNRRVEEDVAPPRRDPEANVEAGKGEFTRTKDGRKIFTLQFQSQLTYGDGRNVFRDVVITFHEPRGADVPCHRPRSDTGSAAGQGARRRHARRGRDDDGRRRAEGRDGQRVVRPGRVARASAGTGDLQPRAHQRLRSRRHVRPGAGRHDPARPGEDHGRAGCRRAGEHGHHGRNRRDGAHGANDPLRAGCHRRRLAAVGVIRHSRRRSLRRRRICWIGSSW